MLPNLIVNYLDGNSCFNVSTARLPMAIKLGRMVTYLDRLVPNSLMTL